MLCWHKRQHARRTDHPIQKHHARWRRVELVVWQVPTPVPPTEHGFKYRAVSTKDGVRMVGFDNERGKGDHCHLDGQEMPYTFTGVDQLVEDFIAAVAARRTT